ncbi:tripartite tricarboxylate transporter TctB family protein [Actinosynnema sp. NPDC053489]|uniref:tripartite tricarboxylate transporter TctB family protein n=1 Tax=Actinosynnema sp. NPDC053489 TaxID=3363916 RepID=UPI0037C7E7A5
MTTPQDPDNQPPQQPYAPPPQQQPYPQQQPFAAPPPLSESELAGSGGTGRPAVAEPREVRLSFFLWLAGALLLVVSSVLVLTQRETALEEARKAPPTPGVTTEQLESAVTAVLVFLVILGIVLAALMAFFAVKARAGRNWARIALTVLGVVVLLYHLFGFSLVGLIIVLVVAAAVVTLYLPASKAYFDSAKRVG